MYSWPLFTNMLKNVTSLLPGMTDIFHLPFFWTNKTDTIGPKQIHSVALSASFSTIVLLLKAFIELLLTSRTF